MDAIIIVLDDETDAVAAVELPELPIVLNTTPATMHNKASTSELDSTSSLAQTASPADVSGSAAFIVSTKDADVPRNPTLVKKKPNVKKIPDPTK